jgi:hypothetical protein
MSEAITRKRFPSRKAETVEFTRGSGRKKDSQEVTVSHPSNGRKPVAKKHPSTSGGSR